jgi:hypothetical protein
VTEHREDKAFEDYLDGRSPLSDSYARLRAAGPSEALDRRILAEARREVGHRDRKTARWRRPWPALATLAVACIAVVVSLDLLRTQSFELRRATDTPVGEIRKLADDAATGRSAEGAAAEHDAGVASLKSVAPEEAAGQAAFQSLSPAEPRREDPRPSRLIGLSGQGADESGIAARAVAPTAFPREADQADAGIPADTDAALANALAIASERVRERRREAHESRTEPAPEAHRDTRVQAQPVASTPASRWPTTGVLEEDPELWLELIDVLMEQGLDESAAVQTQLFRDTFPGHPLEARHEALLTD